MKRPGVNRAASRRSLRLRLVLLTSGIFLVVATALLTATYFLVRAALPRDTPIATLQRSEVKVCQTQQRIAATKNPLVINGHPVPQPNLKSDQQFCKAVFRRAAAIGITTSRSQTLHDLELYSILGLVVMTGASVGASWLLAGRALRPLRDITDAAGRASRDTLGQRIDLPAGGAELKNLADTFDEMLDRLDAAFAAQERFVADASHELRTPLAALRTVVDVTLAKEDPTRAQLDRMGGDVRSLLDQSEALIGALLVMSRSEARATASERIDLAAVVESALETVPEATMTVERDLTPAPVSGDPLLIQRAVANLVDNAVTHNDERRWVRATTFSSEAESGVTIETTGPLVAESDAAQLFRPFYRAAARTGNGHGLGLAIVRSVALAHGGRCEATPRSEGGLAVTMWLPRSGVAPPVP